MIRNAWHQQRLAGKRSDLPWQVLGTRGAVDEGPLREDLRRLRRERPSWAEEPAQRPLVEHAVREALESDVFLGTTPATWSPLGIQSYSSARALGFGEGDGVGLHIESLGGSLPPALSFMVDGNTVAKMTIDDGGFMLPIPRRSHTVGVRVDEASEIWEAIGSIPGGTHSELVHWRVYSGQNSWIRDAVSHGRGGVHRLSFRGLESGGIAVGRVIRVVARHLGSPRQFPFYDRILRRAEGANPQVATSAPRLDGRSAHVDRSVVVVHGTMSTGMQLAAAVLDAATAPVPVRRFEHDTWLPLEENAQELAELVRTKIDGPVCLVSHSRGGLVAARAVSILTSGKPPESLELITLGTPFDGTPVALAARVASLGVSALAGGLIYGGVPCVDPIVRLASFALRLRSPPGLRLMQPGNDALPLLRDAVPASATLFAADADGHVGDRYGLALASGVGRGTFGGKPNDLVVAVESAQFRPQGPAVLDCDHFSYLACADVKAALANAIGRL